MYILLLFRKIKVLNSEYKIKMILILQYNANRDRQDSQVHRIRSSSPMVGVPDATELDAVRPQTAGNYLKLGNSHCVGTS